MYRGIGRRGDKEIAIDLPSSWTTLRRACRARSRILCLAINRIVIGLIKFRQLKAVCNTILDTVRESPTSKYT